MSIKVNAHILRAKWKVRRQSQGTFKNAEWKKKRKKVRYQEEVLKFQKEQRPQRQHPIRGLKSKGGDSSATSEDTERCDSRVPSENSFKGTSKCIQSVNIYRNFCRIWTYVPFYVVFSILCFCISCKSSFLPSFRFFPPLLHTLVFTSYPDQDHMSP